MAEVIIFFPFFLGTFPYGLCKKDIPIIYTLCTFFESWCKHYFFVHSRILFTTLAHFLWTAVDSEGLLSWKASIQIEWQRLHCLQNRPLICVLIQATLWLLDESICDQKTKMRGKFYSSFKAKKSETCVFRIAYRLLGMWWGFKQTVSPNGIRCYLAPPFPPQVNEWERV